MSDLHTVNQKVAEGADWRGTIHVTIDDEEHELTVRQLRDPEFHEVMSLIDRDELQELRDGLPEETMTEYRDLQRKEELDDEERERFEELEAELQDSSINIFDVLSRETFEGIQRCAKYAIEPDEEDKRRAFTERAAEIEKEYGIKVQTPEDVEEALQDDIDAMIENATNFTSVTIGIQALVQSVGEDEGKLES